ncbi:MAG TPA: OmpA family protein [Bryobacteraceae bacterium]|jgi:outer membrane protein OmpA-like peptidoglycan-associated protein|nr:OmpA family protein [Bryobacteraceae bacterium]
MPKRLVVVALALLSSLTAQLRDPSPRPALQYLVDAFDRYPIVALSEAHGSPETMDFITALIRHPGFAGKVSDIVVEFGNGRYQTVMDRYIDGGDVREDELNAAWENTTQVSGVWSSPIYRDFFTSVRALNRTLPAPRRIRVLLGDPPVDWTRVTGPADDDMNDWRDAHFAWVVEQEVLRKGRKALLFIGGAHIGRRVMLPNSLIHILDARFPGKTLVVQALAAGGATPAIASRIRGWPVPSAAEVSGTWLGAADVRDVGFRLSTGRIQDDLDVLLFLTSAQFSNVPIRIDPQSALALELARRRKLHDDTLPFRGGKIRFAQDAARLTGDSESALNLVLSELRRDPSLNLFIKAHADSTESRPPELSLERANLVRDWLVRHGVDPKRFTTEGCAASRPYWISDTDQHRAANRRAELVRKTQWSGCQPPESFSALP